MRIPPRLFLVVQVVVLNKDVDCVLHGDFAVAVVVCLFESSALFGQKAKM